MRLQIDKKLEEKVKSYLVERYLISEEDINTFSIIQVKEKIYLVSRLHERTSECIRRLRPIQVGVKILYVKNTRFIPHININTTLLHKMKLPEVELSKEELDTILNRDFIEKKLKLPEDTTVVLTFNGVRIGLGKYTKEKVIKTR